MYVLRGKISARFFFHLAYPNPARPHSHLCPLLYADFFSICVNRTEIRSKKENRKKYRVLDVKMPEKKNK
jgi:hypothetical protein